MAPTPPTAATPAVEPGPSLLRAAEHAKLTGTELGTMWTFENAPLDYWKQKYDFAPSQQWLDHVRLSSVRFGTFCSASFVSPDGLIMTNHHCGRECVEDNSDAQHDYVANGFYAATRAEEKVCPGLFVDQLAQIQDVTGQVQGVAQAGMTDQQIANAQDSVRDAIEQQCTQTTEYHCQVVNLYHGGQYQLYKYKRYQPIKLVFAPELQAGFFGGDPDNFTYPRYALDITFVRAYGPDGQPVHTDYFKWSPSGAKEGDLVFITGNPGSTSRLATVSQLLYERNVRHPLLADLFRMRSAYLKAWAAKGPEQEREVRQDIFESENSRKLFEGELGGLEDTTMMARKIRWEQEFQNKLKQNPELEKQYGDVWQRIAALQPRKMELRPKVWLYNPQFIGAPQTALAGAVVQYVDAMSKPEAERGRQFQGQALQRLQQTLQSAQPNAEQGIPMLATRLELAQRYLPEGDPLRQVVRPGETPQQAAARLINGSRIGDPAYRQSLMQMDSAALDSVSDPLVSLARDMLGWQQTASEEWQKVSAAEGVQEERLAKAMFGVFGTQLPPDATFTLRISDGVVKGYAYNGTLAPPHTTYYGMYGRAADFRNEMPFKLPATFEKRRDAVDMSKPLDFVSTNDITGGNSGSPMIDRQARVVGIAFDGNIEQLPNEFVYSDVGARMIAVHSAGILEALHSIYQATNLEKEILTAAGAAQ